MHTTDISLDMEYQVVSRELKQSCTVTEIWKSDWDMHVDKSKAHKQDSPK